MAPGERRLAARGCISVAVVACAAALAGCTNPPPSGAGANSTATPSTARAQPVDPVGLLPMAQYDQNVDRWIDPASDNYDRPFLSPALQRAQLATLTARYFGTGAAAPSPWNPDYVRTRVYRQAGADIVALQRRRIDRYDNAGKTGRELNYGQNFRPHTAAWIDAIERNINVDQFAHDAAYQPSHRAISTASLPVRELPTDDPSFFSHTIAGEGYPFDNLQISAVRPGTPLYVLGTSLDGAWRYVQTPDVQGWVAAANVAFTDDRFIERWRAAAQTSLASVVGASVPVSDASGVFRFAAPAGTLLPLAAAPTSKQPLPVTANADAAPQAALRQTMIPVRDIDGNAVIRTAALPADAIVPLPWAATPRHLAMLMKALIGRPYGWGNSGDYNDCSAETQSIFAAFGVWLPRHSSTQMSVGRMTDLSGATPADRLTWLATHGVPYRTLIYIGGHVMLYLGNTTRDGTTVPVVYQDIWGLRPADNSRRAVIGGSVIMPLYLTIPEDASLQSLAATHIFQVSILGDPVDGSAVPADDDNPAS